MIVKQGISSLGTQETAANSGTLWNPGSGITSLQCSFHSKQKVC